MKIIVKSNIRNRITQLTILSLIILLSGCAPLYIPNTVNTPLLSNKGEIQGAVYTGTSGFDPQLAYAITDNIGIMLNGSFENSESDTTGDYHKHQFYELGIGYYKKLSDMGRFEIFGGYGFGNINAYSEVALFNSIADVKSNRIFIQPAFGLSSKIFDLSFASRFVVVNIQNDLIKSTRSFIEPAFTARVGWKQVKFAYQIGYSIPFNEDAIIEYQPLMMSIGIHVNINKVFD